MTELRLKRYTATAAFVCVCLLVACTRPPKPSTIKQPSVFRAETYAVTARINDYLATHNRANTPGVELQETVGSLAHEYVMIAGEARPLRGKTGDKAYAVIASRCDDGVIVAGNLASALAGDPAKRPQAPQELETAIRDWETFNEGLAAMEFVAEANFEPRPWWDDPVWREATTTTTPPPPKTY